MAHGLHRLSAILKKHSKHRSTDRKYLLGDWALDGELHGPRLTLTSVYIEEAGYEDTDDARSISSFSTNATMDNIPGPGRMLDKLYQHLGRKIERGIFRISIYSLHPNKIFQYLWKGESYGLKFCGRSTPSNAIDYVHRELGSASLAGLKGLVYQAQ